MERIEEKQMQKANADTIALILVEEGVENAPYIAVKIAETFDPSPLKCGHPSSLLIRSTESDYKFCEFCEARSERDDALTMERALGVHVRVLENVLRNMIDEGRVASIALAELGFSSDGLTAAAERAVRALARRNGRTAPEANESPS